MRTRTRAGAPALFAALLASTAAAFLAGCGGAAEGAPRVLRVTGIPDSAGTEIDALGKAIENYLGAALGMEVEYVNATDYDAAVAMIGSNKIDVGWFGGVTAVRAIDACAGEATILATRQKDLEFKSYFVANRALVDADRIRPVEDLAELAPMLEGLTFTFGNLLSTSGHIMPRHFMAEAGIDAESGVKGGAKNQRDHTATLNMVADGSVDVGVLNYTNYETASAETRARAVVVYETPTYVDYCLVARDSIGADLQDRIRRAFLELDAAEPAQRAVLEAFKAERFVAADPARWQSIREVLQSLQAAGLLK